MYNEENELIPKQNLYAPRYNLEKCEACSSRLTCNGCCNCGKCKNMILVNKEAFTETDKIFIKT